MDEMEPKRLLLAGDVHGNGRWMGSLCKLARRYDCDAILQLGDFGYWPHTEDGRRFLEHVSWHAEGTPSRGFPVPAVDEMWSTEVRVRVLEAVEATEPAFVVHGHWRHRYSHELTWPVTVDIELAWRSPRVEGLAADIERDRRSWAVLELDPLTFIDAKKVLPGSGGAE